MTKATRPVSWIKPALREFESFPNEARSICLTALTIAAEGGMAGIAKPMRGLGSGVFKIALPFTAMLSVWFMPYSSVKTFGYS